MVNFRILIPLVLLGCMGLVAFGGSTNAAPRGGDPDPDVGDPKIHQTVAGTGDGIAVCNCSANPITGANIPHIPVTGVTLRDGQSTDAGGQSTGLSGVAFGGQTIAPGKCKYVKYAFACRKTGNNWVCWVTSFSLAERDAGEDDCPPDSEDGDD
ncbi:MAG: hypothetical protein GC161_16705 [Planctomycetaceae bacterium]|nr:hypothetical protein [Planctomycetaceae bacterium]